MIPSSFELVAGQMVGEYRVDRKIGEGAFGKVYAAVHPVIGKPAAIKVLNPTLSANPEMVARFADEARAVNQIRHRHIIDIFAFGTLPNGASYFVMELLEGMTFHQYLRQNGPLDPAVAFSILWPVGRALAAAHKAGIAHRDLKPENVFLTMEHDGGLFPKLLDFGIAKLMSEQEMVKRTQTGMLLGTPAYMSPEQCRATNVDHRSDIYAFGIMLHEALAGRRPFDADNVMDVLMMQISSPPPRLSACRPGLPPALDAPLLRMLEKSPARRPESMQAALDELAEAARSCGIAAPVSSAQGAPASGLAPVSAPLSAAGGGPAPRPAPNASVDTGAWLQQQSGQGSMAVPATSLAVPQGSLAVPQGSMAVPQGSMAVSQGSMAASPGGPIPSLVAGPPSGAPYSGAMAHSTGGVHYPSSSYAGPAPNSLHGPHSPSASYGGVPPADVATMMSAGVQQRVSSPSFPGGPVSGGPVTASVAGPAPHSAALPPAAPKSKLPLFLGAGGVLLLLLLLIGGGLALSGGGGSGADSRPGASSPSASPSVAPGAVLIGAAPPRVGRTFQQESDTRLEMIVSLPGAKRPLMSNTHGVHRSYKATVLAVNEWNATRLEVQYTDSYETDQKDKQPEKKTVSPTDHSGYFVAVQDSGPLVSSMDGKQVTDLAKAQVLSSVGDLLQPRQDMFRRPLSVGDSLNPPSSIAARLLGITSDEADTTMRAENTVLRLTAIDPAGRGATFDVQLSLVMEQKKMKLGVTMQLKGTMTFDVATGMPASGDLSGPLEGSFTESGVKANLEGSASVRVKSDITP